MQAPKPLLLQPSNQTSFAAGVGRTYEVLQEGHRLKRQGVDVVVGFGEDTREGRTVAAFVQEYGITHVTVHRFSARKPLENERFGVSRLTLGATD